MLADTNNGLIFLAGLLIILLLIAMVIAEGTAKEKGKKSEALIIVPIIIGVIIGMLYYNNAINKKNKLATYKSFEKGEDILCYEIGKTYIVSKKREWKIYKSGFSKGDILLDVRGCQVQS